MNDQPHDKSDALAGEAPGGKKPVTVTPQTGQAAPPPPLRMMLSDEDAGACTGDACVIPVRQGQGEVK